MTGIPEFVKGDETRLHFAAFEDCIVVGQEAADKETTQKMRSTEDDEVLMAAPNKIPLPSPPFVVVSKTEYARERERIVAD